MIFMVRRYNNREWTHHKKEVIRPTYEKIAVEIFSFEHKYTKLYKPNAEDFENTNAKKVSNRCYNCYCSDDELSSFVLELDYLVEETGEYRIDIVYENKNAEDYIGSYDLSLIHQKSPQLYSNAAIIAQYTTELSNLNEKLKVAKEAEKTVTQTQIEEYSSKLREVRRIEGSEIKFDGELNIVKRKTLFHQLSELGQYRLTLELPVNCYFIGAIFRKVKTYTGDNLDSVGTNLAFKEATISKSGQVKPAEASFEIAYDNSFENKLTRTGFYFDYNDEVNIYVKENADFSNNEMIRRFGGYLSTISTDNNRTKLTISCADRLIDGESKYILDSLQILDGTTSNEDTDYTNPISFQSYGEALKYLCDIYETTLESNISKNFLVDGEKYTTGLSLQFGTSKDIKEVTKKNAEATPQDNFITLRNQSSGLEEQSIVLYNGKDHSKLPVEITNYLTFHMTYGMGDPKQEIKSETIVSGTDTSENAGSQKFSKCGVSADKKYVMAIGLPSAAKDSMSGWTKTVFERRCPHCNSNDVIWDWNWGSYSSCRGAREGGSTEGHLFCRTCDADYSVQGYEHISGSKYHMTKASSTVKSSKAEAQKLKNGEMTAVAKSGESVSSVDAIASVANIMKKYSYALGSASTYSAMKKSGKGDCWAFSDGIFTELKKLGVSCKIYDYITSYSDHHRTVAYLNANNQWVDFPYKQYGFSNMLYVTSNRPSLKSEGIKNFYGSNSASVTTSTDSSSSSTTTLTTTTGYDKDKPFQGYIELVYSTQQDWDAEQKKVNLNFTQKAGTDDDLSGLSSYWINNALRQTSVNMKDYFADNEGDNQIYLISIRLVAPKMEVTDEANAKSKDVNWYTFDDSTHDYSSCKMDLYQIIFDDAMALNPTDLASCGKSVTAMMEEIVKSSGYRASMNYGKHRKDDVINFSIDNQTKPRLVLTEGDNNNILEWTNISCSPVSSLRNKSICVFKNVKGKYNYVDTVELDNVLEYGERTTLQTSSDEIGSKEAYFNARSSTSFNPEFDYTYSIVTPYAPNLQLGDLIEVISNYQYLNDIKPLESIQIKYSYNTKPVIQTTVGIGELEPYLRIKQDIQQLRVQNKDSTVFSSSAVPIEDENIFIWDR